MIPISKLKDIYKNKPIAVLGGGPSLPADVKKLPQESIYISVNHHALYRYRCVFMAFMDDPEAAKARGDVDFADIVYNQVIIKISPLKQYTNIEIDVDFWDPGFSGPFGTWTACWFGGNPVLLCGMDCHRGNRSYFHPYNESEANRRQRSYPLENHLKAWRPALTHCRNSRNIKAVSGPLIEIFGEYEKKKN